MNREETHAKARALIESAGTRFMSAEFVKKDGSTRVMVIHPTAIRNRLVGEAASESAKQAVETRKRNHPELYNVVDVAAIKAGEETGIRSINLDTLRVLTIDGERHDFEPVMP